MTKNYRVGLDIGIGSVGWAVISGSGKNAHIEDFGVRIFESGELDSMGKNRKSQKRRDFRSNRRLIRRRFYRKERLKAHMEKIGFVSNGQLSLFYESNKMDMYSLRARGVLEKLMPEETAACLIHICNHRGYRDFYEAQEGDGEPESFEQKEEAANQKALNAFQSLLEKEKGMTPAQVVCRCFSTGSKYVDFRNSESKTERYLISRQDLKEEAEKILKEQGKYYPCWNAKNIDLALKIIFAQRDFEDGPGDPNDSFRRYTGFLDSIGFCMYYKELARGFRSTVISDIYAVTNTLSQYRYVNEKTGEYELPVCVTKALVDSLLKNGNITMTEVKKILKSFDFLILKSENSDDKALAKAVKYLKVIKPMLEEEGIYWNELIAEDQLDEKNSSKLHRLGEVISKYQTPARRKSELQKLGFLSESLIRKLMKKKISGTSNVSYKYMCEAIEAFLKGEIYGNFQARKIKSMAENQVTGSGSYLLPALEDEEIRNNPVVFRAINETKKIINEIIRSYGSPECINVEVASELSRSFNDRMEIAKKQKDDEKKNEKMNESIAKILGIPEDEVRPTHREKYILYEQQSGKCLYSGKSLGDIGEVLSDDSGRYEIDHIVPYSLILDNTLHNKALVFGSENQYKRQRTPLMYMGGERAGQFLAIVNSMYSRKENPISLKKYQYLTLADIYSPEAISLLDNWKSRNINDTRYITKFIVGYLKSSLQFAGSKEKAVYGIKGGITSRFRRLWLNEKTWGSQDKNRDTYLNHAVDAVIVANLTPAYVEIASDNVKLNQILRRCKTDQAPEYQEYLDKCIKKMSKYYGFKEEYTKNLLSHKRRVPSFVPNLRDEVDIRFNDSDEELFQKQIMFFYQDLEQFKIKPHMPVTSHKPIRKYCGKIADENPIRIVEINGDAVKIKRKKVVDISSKDLPKIRTADQDLLDSFNAILKDAPEGYTIGKYLKENNMERFKTLKGQPVNKVSVIEGPVTNYYPKQIDANNFSILGSMKYHCMEVYRDREGKLDTWGIRFVDIVRKDKKLWLKKESLPENYGEHVTYLFKNDYLEITNKKGEIKFRGFFKAVYNINQNAFSFAEINKPMQSKKYCIISKNDTIRKYYIDILGRKGGEIRCSAPLLLTRENI